MKRLPFCHRSRPTLWNCDFRFPQFLLTLSLSACPQSNVTESLGWSRQHIERDREPDSPAVISIDGFTRFCYIYPKFRFRVTNMENVLTLNQKSQIVISKKIRKSLGLKPGDQLAAAVEGNKIVLRLKPKSPSSRLRGIGKGTWGSKTKIDAYIEKLRDEWERA
jgi:AbrB family looped-hinge helix DNA binding protein